VCVCLSVLCFLCSVTVLNGSAENQTLGNLIPCRWSCGWLASTARANGLALSAGAMDWDPSGNLELAASNHNGLAPAWGVTERHRWIASVLCSKWNTKQEKYSTIHVLNDILLTCCVSGKILEDSKVINEYKIEEKNFVVVMVTKVRDCNVAEF